MGNLSTFFPAPSSSNLLEQINYYADGKTISTSSGNITLPNITAISYPGTSYTEVPGTSITYLPPAGTTKVLYETSIVCRYYNDTRIAASWYVDFDGTQITQTRRAELQQDSYETVINSYASINIDGTDNIGNSQISTWPSAKVIRTMCACLNTSYEFYVNGAYHYSNGSTSSNPIVCPPFIKITAIK